MEVNSENCRKTVCSFCCKSEVGGGIGGVEGEEESRDLVVERFVTFLEKYVGTPTSKDQLLSSFKTEEGFIRLSWKSVIVSCPQCGGELRRFCELYREMERIQLEINGRLEALLRKMEKAGRMPSRIKRMRPVYKRLEGSEGAQSEVEDIMRIVTDFRTDVIKKCTAQLARITPKVVLKEEPDLLLSWKSSLVEGSTPMEESSSELIKSENEDSEDQVPEDIFLTPTLADDNSKDGVLEPSKSPPADDPPPPSHETRPSIYTCNLCSKAFRSQSGVQKHLRTIHKSSPSSFRTSQPNLKITCSLCPTTFRNQGSARRHLRQIHKMSLEESRTEFAHCQITPRTSSDTKRQRKLEVPLPHLRGIFPCLFCDDVFNYAPDLALHEHHQHPCTGPPEKSSADKPFIYNCPRCSVTFGSESRYITHHLETHLGVTRNSLFCDICSQRLPTGKDKQYHFRHYHDTSKLDASAVQKCDQCSAYFLNLKQLLRHKRLVHGDIDAQNSCPVCGRQFKWHCTMTTHLRNPHKIGSKDPRPPKKEVPIIPCPEPGCGRPCAGPDGLRIHSKVHRRSYICEICGANFKKKSILDRHYLFHKSPEELEFVCSEPGCSKRCPTVYNLREHERVHSGAKPFQCQVCGQKYAGRKSLRKHVNTKHKEEGVQDIPRKKAKAQWVPRREPKEGS